MQPYMEEGITARAMRLQSHADAMRFFECYPLTQSHQSMEFDAEEQGVMSSTRIACDKSLPCKTAMRGRGFLSSKRTW
eukprot:1162119-Pelagomonas_calceolata.AAC.3